MKRIKERIQLRRKIPKLSHAKLPKFPHRKKLRSKQQIWIYNEGRLEQERIYPERWMRLIYENPVGGASLLWLVKRKTISRLYGLYCRTPMSARGIQKFISEYDIDMTGCQPKYKNFAQFFSREKTDVTFPSDASILGSPCEGLVSVSTGISPQQVVFAKGSNFSLSELFADEKLAEAFTGGTMVSIRLTPSNYLRMHFFDDAAVVQTRMIKGHLYSVSPLALTRVMDLYCRNKRAVIQLSTANFGDVVLVEVGATFVGSIVHCFDDGQDVKRGDVASYFKPGGSLVLMFLKKDAFVPDPGIVRRSAQGIETKTLIAMPIGSRA